MIDTRGLDCATIAGVRLVMEQLCSDARNPATVCAHIMDEMGVTVRDVLDVCDVARAAILDARRPRQWRTTPQPIPVTTSPALVSVAEDTEGTEGADATQDDDATLYAAQYEQWLAQDGAQA